MVGMANGLDLPVVAEGVETAAQREFLRGIGCSELQGYLISKPVPAEEMVTLLRRSERRSARARSEEHTSELQSLMRISYAVFCLKKKNRQLCSLRSV